MLAHSRPFNRVCMRSYVISLCNLGLDTAVMKTYHSVSNLSFMSKLVKRAVSSSGGNLVLQYPVYSVFYELGTFTEPGCKYYYPVLLPTQLFWSKPGIYLVKLGKITRQTTSIV